MLIPPMGRGRFYDLVHKFGVSFCIGLSLLAVFSFAKGRLGKHEIIPTKTQLPVKEELENPIQSNENLQNF